MLKIFSDGGSRGNPGPSAYGLVVVHDGDIIHEESEYIGIQTNNYAEYRGLIAGIRKAIELCAKDVEFIMDSQLVIRQMKGEYKVKAPELIELNRDAKALCSMIPKVRFTDVRRHELMMPRADELVNIELDKHHA
ncbi:MAG TPA: ribonuclease HI family protein [Candidatus Methanomethylophilaceae archaeon]|nr:ribonuclease HI family protein [Candidatus Methanomethylophilaceae archaeon]